MYELYVIYYDDCGEYKETVDVCLVTELSKAKQLKHILEYYYKNTDCFNVLVGFSQIARIKHK